MMPVSRMYGMCCLLATNLSEQLTEFSNSKLGYRHWHADPFQTLACKPWSLLLDTHFSMAKFRKNPACSSGLLTPGRILWTLILYSIVWFNVKYSDLNHYLFHTRKIVLILYQPDFFDDLQNVQITYLNLQFYWAYSIGYSIIQLICVFLINHLFLFWHFAKEFY